MFDIGIIAKVKQTVAEFKAKNPEVVDFGNKVIAKGFCEGQQVQITVTYPDGTEYKADMTVKKDDLQMLNTISSIKL